MSRHNCKLPFRERRDKVREDLQFYALNTILKKNTFNSICILVSLDLNNKFRSLSDNKLEFVLKGIFRCELLNKKKIKWRRFLGTTKKHWKTTHYKNLDLPLNWKSRIDFRLLGDHIQTLNKLKRCPIYNWYNLKACSLLENLQNKNNEEEKLALFQIRDVILDQNNKFSDLIINFLENQSSTFKYISHNDCLSRIKLSRINDTDAKIVPSLTFLKFKIDIETKLHSSYGTEFARYAKPARSRGRSSVNFEIKRYFKNLKPAFLVSSLKGIFRTTTAWLFERIAEELAMSHPITCDFSVKWDKKKICPVCKIYGGPFREQLDEQKQFQSIKSKVRLFIEGERKSAALFGTINQIRELPFTHEIINNNSGKLNIETLNFDNGQNLMVEIHPNQDWEPILASVCLSADLINSSFFRAGKFTSRGFGILKIIPLEYLQVNLQDLLENQNKTNSMTPHNNSNFLLAKQILKKDPLIVLSEWLKDFFS
ncbi:MAG: hypothetical protein ACTSVV_09850 [Promethearchaeota archaeon]